MNQQINPEEAIERVLAGLRRAEPPEGMERRVMDAAQHRIRKPSREPRLASLSLHNLQPWTIIGLGVIIFSLAASVAVHRKVTTRHEPAVANMYLSPQVITMQTSHKAEAKPTRPIHENAVSYSERSASKPEPGPMSAEEALAVSEMNAPSKPAPPLPLTHQEQLLASAVHQAGPEKLSSLRPEVRARQMELSKAEFRDFFERPPAKDNE